MLSNTKGNTLTIFTIVLPFYESLFSKRFKAVKADPEADERRVLLTGGTGSVDQKESDTLCRDSRL